MTASADIPIRATIDLSHDGLNLVGETTGGSVANYAFGPGIDKPLIVNKAGAISYFNADGLGSVAGTTSPAGTFDYNSVFDAWGSARSETGTRTISFTYTGREVSDAGLQFYRARYYQPSVGRFQSEDLLRQLADVSDFRYVFNNPLTLCHPFGLQTVPVCTTPPPPHTPPNFAPPSESAQAACAWVCNIGMGAALVYVCPVSLPWTAAGRGRLVVGAGMNAYGCTKICGYGGPVFPSPLPPTPPGPPSPPNCGPTPDFCPLPTPSPNAPDSTPPGPVFPGTPPPTPNPAPCPTPGPLGGPIPTW